MAITKANPTPSDRATGDAAPSRADTIESLRAELVAGVQGSLERDTAESGRLLETTSTLHAMIELLAERGLISIEELTGRRVEAKERLAEEFFDQGMGVTLLGIPHPDKYTYKVPAGADVDCAARLHICRAICCKMAFPLSEQDVEEGIIRWELGDPYLARKGDDGLCYHLDRTTRFCTVREQRPIPCRGYSCQYDKRIWQDFDNMVLAPDVETVLGVRKRSQDLMKARRERQQRASADDEEAQS
jgi:Fe-S-cluster containining protein